MQPLPSPQPSPAEMFRPVVLVPTYNNAGTLRAVLDRIEPLGLPVFVVDDGSTDATAEVLRDWLVARPGNVRSVTRHPVNRGKSDALRTGFAAAMSAGFTHAVTIDSDGQHNPEEIPALLAAAEREPTALVLGVRSDRIEHCPARSLQARKVANTLTALECGLRLTDTQCGLRVYPLGLVAAVPCRAHRYGYEAEIIPRAAWAGCPVREVPISCLYCPHEERVSHFQPYRDSLRQLRMHIGLIARALVPWRAHPRWPGGPTAHAHQPAEMVKEAWTWISPARAWQEIRDDPDARPQMALGVAIGVFIGNMPPGLHTIGALYVARRLHLHPLPPVLGTQIAFPPWGWALIVAHVYTGYFLLHGAPPHLAAFDLRRSGFWTVAGHATLEYLVGCLVLGTVLSVVSYAVTFRLLSRLPARTPDDRPDTPAGTPPDRPGGPTART